MRVGDHTLTSRTPWQRVPHACTLCWSWRLVGLYLTWSSGWAPSLSAMPHLLFGKSQTRSPSCTRTASCIGGSPHLHRLAPHVLPADASLTHCSDIKMANLLVADKSSFVVKVSDFGCVAFLESATRANSPPAVITLPVAITQARQNLRDQRRLDT